jgi:hypothetical protein
MPVTLQSHIMPQNLRHLPLTHSEEDIQTVWRPGGHGGDSRPDSRTERVEVADVLENLVGEMSMTLGDCFVRTAAELDLQILTRDYQRQQCSLHTGTLDVQSFAGCVLATMTLCSSEIFIPLPPPFSLGATTPPVPSSPTLTTTDTVSWNRHPTTMSG